MPGKHLNDTSLSTPFMSATPHWKAHKCERFIAPCNYTHYHITVSQSASFLIGVEAPGRRKTEAIRTVVSKPHNDDFTCHEIEAAVDGVSCGL